MRASSPSPLLLSLYLVVFGVLGPFTIVLSASTGRKIVFLNESNGRVEIYWINPSTREASLMSSPDVLPGADFTLDSFVGHEFQVREKKSCKEGPETEGCRKCNFAVSSNDDQKLHISAEIECSFVDNKVLARQEANELVADCHQRALAKVSSKNVSTAIEDLVACVQGGVASRLEEIQEEIAFQSTVRQGIAGRLENYTCLDDTVDSSTPVNEKWWIHDRDPSAGRRKVLNMLDRPSSKIHVIKNFIMPDECDAMEASAKPILHKATVADGRGGSKLSDSRKAMQAGIKVPWDKEADGNPIARLSRRVYDYANDVLGLNIEEHGQEDLMSIQYFGRGLNDTQPDRYTPHCDGDCTGLKHKSGNRMATMVMYCTVADRGGHTNFRNAGVHVKPETGTAVFFAYIDPVSRVMDSGFTEHSGCPVYEGEKKIVTQWIRLGVDSENPWNSFNTLGIQVSKLQPDDEEEGEEGDEEGEGDEDSDLGSGDNSSGEL